VATRPVPGPPHQALQNPALARETGSAAPQKLERERRAGFQFADVSVRVELPRFAHGPVRSMKKLVRMSSLMAGGAAAPIPSRSASNGRRNGRHGWPRRLAARVPPPRRTPYGCHPGVGGDVLQIVAELQRDAPGESKLDLDWRERARGEPGVRNHRCAALLEDDFEDIARAGPGAAMQLEALLLRAMDGAQAGEYLGCSPGGTGFRSG